MPVFCFFFCLYKGPFIQQQFILVNFRFHGVSPMNRSASTSTMSVLVQTESNSDLVL